MKFLLLFLLLLHVQVQVPLAAAEPQWDAWRTVSTSHGVQVEYRTRPYVTKTKTQTAVQWRVRNQTPGPVNVELVKTYRSHAETQRTEKVSALAPGTVYDPSPDYVTGIVNNVQVAVRVTSKDGQQQQQQQPPATPQRAQSLTQDQFDEIAELKRHVAAVQAQKMNPAPTNAPASPVVPAAGTSTDPVSPKGKGPFDSDEPSIYFGWAGRRVGGVAYISQIYKYKGSYRAGDKGDAFVAYLAAHGIHLPEGHQVEYGEYNTLEEARAGWAKRLEELRSSFRVVETQHVWR